MNNSCEYMECGNSLPLCTHRLAYEGKKHTKIRDFSYFNFPVVPAILPRRQASESKALTSQCTPYSFLISLLILILLFSTPVFAQTNHPVRKSKPKSAPKQTEIREKQEALADFAGGNINTDAEIGIVSGFHGLVRSNLSKFQITKENAQKAGLNVYESPRLLLITDLQIDDDLKQWGNYLEQAIVQWADYFHVPVEKLASWRIHACVMKDNIPFMTNDLLPTGLPSFDYGFEYGNNIWLYAQESRDYQRHLFLHECTHAFMNQVLNGCGSLWYGEGLAEYFGTHRIENGKLIMGIMPKSRNEFPHWGRIRFIQNDIQNGTFVSLNDFLSTELKSQDNHSYSWAWALIWMLNSDSQNKELLQHLSNVEQGKTYSQRAQNLNKMFRESYTDEQWSQLSMQWQAFISNLEYGMIFQQNTFPMSKSEDLSGTVTKSIQSDKDWQSLGIELKQGKTYRIQATGNYTISSDENKSWPCEPNGITIRYFRQKPLGALMAAVVTPDMGENTQLSGFNNPILVGTSTQFTAKNSGVLWLKTNRLPNLESESGSDITVTVREVNK